MIEFQEYTFFSDVDAERRIAHRLFYYVLLLSKYLVKCPSVSAGKEPNVVLGTKLSFFNTLCVCYTSS